MRMVPVSYEALGVEDDILATLPAQLPEVVLANKVSLRTEVRVEGFQAPRVIHLVIAPLYDLRHRSIVVVVARDSRRMEQEGLH